MGSVDRERRLATWRNLKWLDDDSLLQFSAYHVGQAFRDEINCDPQGAT